MPASSTTHEHVQRMLDEIQRNYNRRLTLGTLARTLRRQSAYLGRLFREEIGVTVHEYITRARMEYGSAHIRSGVKIEAVALESGYQSKKNFYRQFRRRFGMTPEEYRREHCQGAVANPAAAEPSRDPHNSTKESALSSRAARLAVGTGRAGERD
ncbi:MAG TPA: helix-turn-helix domain-containing protein [Gemmatimonadaceae bacterium]|nr:helix-turn-helix domain-containing protein [Gemmatimonadaceae bacterium]